MEAANIGGQPTVMAVCWSILSLGYKEGYRVDVDIPEGTWAHALSFHDILIFNKGHWGWLQSLTQKTPIPFFFRKGLPVTPPVPAAVGLDSIMKYMVEKLFALKSMEPMWRYG